MKKAVAAGMITLFAGAGLLATGTSASAATMPQHKVVTSTHRDWDHWHHGWGDEGWHHGWYHGWHHGWGWGYGDWDD